MCLLGMDPKVLSSIINTSSGRNWSSDTYNPVPGVMEKVPSSRDYTGGFAIELMTKDMQLAAQAAADSKSFNLIGAAAKELYQQCCKDEKLKGKDFSSVYQWMSRK
jgi:3-hydroxyisobutyrate dehydrogenase-like beta-hydroxyacid dehydrogenase